MIRSYLKWASYRATQCALWLIALVVFRARRGGIDLIPATGAALFCSNHQSFLDPMLIGAASPRRLNYLARDTLFKSRFFGWLIRWYDSIPIDRTGMGISGIKETLRRLKREQAVVVFPEGTRTRDGEIASLKPGFCAIARRGKATLVPIGIEGAFDAWPRGQKWPKTKPIRIEFGEPIPPETAAEWDDEQLVAELERRIRECHERARAKMKK